MLESHPDWVRVKARKCLDAGTPERLIRSLACDVAADYLGNVRRHLEVLPFVRENLEVLAS